MLRKINVMNININLCHALQSNLCGVNFSNIKQVIFLGLGFFIFSMCVLWIHAGEHWIQFSLLKKRRKVCC